MKENKNFDLVVFLFMVILMIFGLLNLYSVSKTLFLKQLIWDFLAAFGAISVYFLKENFLRKMIFLLYFLSTILLLAVLFFGTRIYGSIRWFRIFGVSFQPSELSKLTLILLLSYIFLKRDVKSIFISIVATLIPVFLILKEPDLGMTILHLFIWFILLYFSGVSLKIILPLIGTGFTMIPIVYFFFLKDYQRNRILSFLNPEKYAKGAAYNVIMSRSAIGSGGLFGNGYLISPAVKGYYVPKMETDFIFSAIGEQFGFLGSIILLSVYILIVLRVFSKMKYYKDDYWKLVSVGILAVFVFHVFENIGMNIGIMPVTGIPLPFISYGGTSTFIFGLMVGFLLKALALVDKSRKVV
ncbi:cell cycle protein [Thermosipho sp. 1063]|uniref:FtsW/RodA/SpoVE family cell cycle protein n=1 Tax=unclassified Thermosipho (in: thermotogales) TaxID=2676525 RepID=UPI0009492774|nr:MULTISPECIES: FtsW/RodA/SpoVE family cell cycle protein [unclassified Thermosipho (in: thermotogales)]ANQ53591.1 cell cycle protein [Thermosipho sp. 1070]APT72039.1 cell cycle protein [Thermosipho sp. 1063]